MVLAEKLLLRIELHPLRHPTAARHEPRVRRPLHRAAAGPPQPQDRPAQPDALVDLPLRVHILAPRLGGAERLRVESVDGVLEVALVLRRVREHEREEVLRLVGRAVGLQREGEWGQKWELIGLCVCVFV